MIDSFLHGLFTRRINAFKGWINRRGVTAIYGSMNDGAEGRSNQRAGIFKLKIHVNYRY
jgi:hypothetical protein